MEQTREWRSVYLKLVRSVSLAYDSAHLTLQVQLSCLHVRLALCAFKWKLLMEPSTHWIQMEFSLATCWLIGFFNATHAIFSCRNVYSRANLLYAGMLRRTDKKIKLSAIFVFVCKSIFISLYFFCQPSVSHVASPKTAHASNSMQTNCHERINSDPKSLTVNEMNK